MKQLILKKLKNKFESKALRYKKLYKKVHSDFETLKSITDITTLRPIKGELREYQLKTLSFVNGLLDKFEQNGINYFITAGNLIGQVRHKGFIPWDDDFDVAMMREDYVKTLDFCEKNYIQIDVSKIYFSKNNRHQVWVEYMKKYPNQILFSRTPHHIQIISGTTLDDVLCLDIFPFDYYSDNGDVKKHKMFLTNFRKKMLETDCWKDVVEYCDKERKNNPNIVEKSHTIYHAIDSLLGYLESNSHKKWLFSSDIFPLKKAVYENEKIFIPNNPHSLLESLYGDYMNFPEKIEIASHIASKKQAVQQKKQKKYNNNQKNILIKKIKNLFDNKELRYKNLYKNTLQSYSILLDTIDIQKLLPANGEARQYQLKTQDYLCEIIDLFNKNDIEYFLTAGSLLGANRHKGFIPWDDDIDIAMMRKSYTKMMDFCEKNFVVADISKFNFSQNNRHEQMQKLLEQYPNQNIYLRTPRYTLLFKGTSLVDYVSVDIFSSDYYADNYTMDKHRQYLQDLKMKMLELDRWDKINLFFDKERESNKNIVEHSDKIYYSIDSLDSYSEDRFNDKWFSEADIYPLKQLLFENRLFSAPSNERKILEVMYGSNYSKMPEKFSFSPNQKIKMKSYQN